MANFSNSTSSTLVSGTSAADSIYNSGNYVTVKAGKGNDIVNSLSYGSILYGEGGNDSIVVNHFSGETVIGGKGNDTVSLVSASYGTNYARVINYASGDGKDIIYGLSAYDTIHITKGKYSTVKSGSDIVLNVGSGKITLKDMALSSVQVQAADGTVATVTAYNVVNNVSPHTLVSGTDSDDAVVSSANFVTIDGGKGNDIISGGYYNYISGGAGKDSIGISGYSSTINAGAGNDTISFDSNYSNALVQYAAGDGKDIISGFSSTDTLHITNGTYTTTTSGDDIILTIKNGTVTGSVTFKDAIAETLTVKNSSGTVEYIQAANQITNYSDTQVVNATKKRDYIENHGDKVTVNAAAGNDTIANYGGNSKINGGDGADLIGSSEIALHVTISGGKGNDEIESYADYSSITGGADNDTITSYSGYASTINGGTGNDLISLSSSANYNFVAYALGDGNDTVEGFGTDDVLRITKGAYNAKASGSDVVVTVGKGDNKGTVTLKDAAGKKITIISTSGKVNTKTYGSASSALFEEENNFSELDSIVDKNIVGEVENNQTEKLTQEKLITFAK